MNVGIREAGAREHTPVRASTYWLGIEFAVLASAITSNGGSNKLRHRNTSQKRWKDERDSFVPSFSEWVSASNVHRSGMRTRNSAALFVDGSHSDLSTDNTPADCSFLPRRPAGRSHAFFPIFEVLPCEAFERRSRVWDSSYSSACFELMRNRGRTAIPRRPRGRRGQRRLLPRPGNWPCSARRLI